MNMAAPNILNLLLGIAPAKSGVPNGAVAPSLDMLFGDVMQIALGRGRVLGSETQVGPFGQPLAKSDPTVSLPQFAMPQAIISQVRPETVKTVDVASAVGNTIEADGPQVIARRLQGWDFEGIESIETIPANTNLVAGNGPGIPGIVSEEIPGEDVESLESDPAVRAVMEGIQPRMAGAVIGAQIERLFVSAEGQLPIGKYAVADYRINDGQLTMDLVPEEAPDTMIRVTLPLSAVADGLANTEVVSTNAARVALDSAAPHRSLAALFADVRLKELVVKPAAQSATPAQPTVANTAEPVTPVEFKLFAETTGQEMVIRANLSRGDVRTRVMVGEQGRSTAATLDRSAEGVPLRAGAATVVPGISRDGSVEDFLLPRGMKDRFVGLVGREMSDAKATNENVQGIPDFARSTTELTMSRERVEPAARYSLPPDVKQMLRPNGRSVQLRIDPEHLGPARLSLSMQNDQLRALVVVDSPQARQAVEGSLDRLVDSLQRADIKVDYIEVTVDQQGARDEMYAQHHPRWSRPERPGHFTGIENEFTAAPAVVAASGRMSYIGAGGVNVLA